MKITNLQLVQFFTVYNELIKKKLPIVMAYAFRYNFKILSSAFSAFEESRKELIEKYAEKDKDGELIVDENGNLKLKGDAVKVYNELLTTTFEENIKTIKTFELERTECEEFDNISMNELDAIMFMIED